MLPLSESRWWYDTTYPQYIEGSIILSEDDGMSEYGMSEDDGMSDEEEIQEIVEDRTFDELVDGTNSVSLDVWITGDGSNQHNNLRRTRESVQFLAREKGVSASDIVRNEREDAEFMRRMTRGETSVSPNRVCREHEIEQYEGDVIADINTLSLSPVNIRGRETIRDSNWFSRSDMEDTPTLTSTRPGHYSHSLGERQEWQIPSSSSRLIRIGSRNPVIRDVSGLESMFNNRYNGETVEYNGSPSSSVLENVLYYSEEDDDIDIVYSSLSTTDD